MAIRRHKSSSGGTEAITLQLGNIKFIFERQIECFYKQFFNTWPKQNNCSKQRMEDFVHWRGFGKVFFFVVLMFLETPKIWLQIDERCAAKTRRVFVQSLGKRLVRKVVAQKAFGASKRTRSWGTTSDENPDF